MEETELDRVRKAYVSQIMEAVKRDDETSEFMVDYLLMEWGAKAFKDGKRVLIAETKKYWGECA